MKLEKSKDDSTPQNSFLRPLTFITDAVRALSRRKRIGESTIQELEEDIEKWRSECCKALMQLEDAAAEIAKLKKHVRSLQKANSKLRGPKK